MAKLDVYDNGCDWEVWVLDGRRVYAGHDRSTDAMVDLLEEEFEVEVRKYFGEFRDDTDTIFTEYETDDVLVIP